MGRATVYLTADYEVFGDGSGCVTACVIRPSEQMMTIAEEWGARITFFVDVCELWAFEEALAQCALEASRLPVEEIRNQLRDMIRRGHDVQLHLHPQWLGAKWQDPDGWKLRMDWWRLSSYAAQMGGDAVEALVRRGREWLETLLKPIDPSYSCRAFRAGAWSIQPEGEVVEALHRAGIEFDTTVAPGKAHSGDHTYYDFREAPSDRWDGWLVRSLLCTPEPTGTLMEVPIFTMKEPWRTRFRRLMRRAREGSPRGNLPSGCRGSTEGHTSPSLLSRVLSLRSRVCMLDFCSTPEILMREMIAAVNDAMPQREPDWRIVAIGHPKEFGRPERLTCLLESGAASPHVRIDSLTSRSLWRGHPESC